MFVTSYILCCSLSMGKLSLLLVLLLFFLDNNGGSSTSTFLRNTDTAKTIGQNAEA